MLYVVRHGETDYNVARRICGHAEAQLTERLSTSGIGS